MHIAMTLPNYCHGAAALCSKFQNTSANRSITLPYITHDDLCLVSSFRIAAIGDFFNVCNKSLEHLPDKTSYCDNLELSSPIRQ